MDISEKMGPVRSQGSTGWCYAFTAADLIGYAMGVTPANQVSAADVAAAYYLGEPKSLSPDAGISEDYLKNAARSLENRKKSAKYFGKLLSERSGGHIDKAIAAYNFRGGMCLESQVPSQKSEVFLDAHLYISQKFGWDLLPKDQGTGMMAPLDPLTSLGNILPANTFDGVLCPSGVIKKADLDFNELTKKTNEEASRQADAMINKACLPRMPLERILTRDSVDDEDEGGKPEMLRQMNQQLSLNNPVGISYNDCFLTSHEFDGSKQGCGHHASSVAGRRKNPKTGQCEYKIRNSWGLSCENYRKDLVCEHGNIWVGQEELIKNTRSATWITKP